VGGNVSFTASIGIRITDRTSLAYDVNKHLTWNKGDTAVNVTIVWTAASESPWAGHEFILSSQVRAAADRVAAGS
jgi:hypothetical protein